jgi:CSLREA domain-containing protein
MSDRQQQRRARRRRKHSERSSTRRLVAAGGLTAGATLAFSGVAQAAPVTYTVGTNADDSTGGACTTPANTDCSLREAISLANANADPGDTIVFNSNLTGATITLTTGELSVTKPVTITGPGASQLTVDGRALSRIFNVDPTTPSDPVSIESMTISHGYEGSSSGGAIFNEDADLTLTNDVISDSYATYDNFVRGGGVYTDVGSLAVDSSTISGNHAFYGGGIGSMTGSVTVTDSTLSDNHADGHGPPNYDRGYGGGINAYAADVTVTGSTIDNNVGGYDGGGIYSASGGNGGAVTVTNSTIANNHALNDDGGAVWICCGETNDALTVIASTVTGNTAATNSGGLESYITNQAPVLQNSIVSGNTGGNPPADDLYAESGYEFQASFDLIGVPTITFINDIVGNVLGGNPRLGPLADNGGPTVTMAPQCGSDAIDQGKAFALTEDQRGLTRPVGLTDYPDSGATGADGSDIGAVELQTTPGSVCITESPKSKGFGSQTVGTSSASQTFTVTGIGPDTVHIASAALAGTDSAQFTKTNDTCSGAALTTNGSCTVGVSFAPGSTGAKAAQLRLTDDAIDAPQNLSLTGTGVVGPPAPTPTPTTPHKKKCKKHKKKHKRSADSAKKKKCKKKKKK